MYPTHRSGIPGCLAVATVAIISGSPAFTSWWCLDDWGQLARAAGTLPGPVSFPARWLSQHAYWSATWPLLGPDFTAHTIIRLLLHAIAACTVQRIALGAGLERERSLLAGLLFAASPVAFTPLVWASGIQELLSGCLALLAMVWWLTTGRRYILLAGLSLCGSILAKESGFGLPLLFIGFTVFAHRGARGSAGWRLGTSLACLALVVWESSLLIGHFATGPADPYRLGGIVSVLGNLGMFGWWLMTPGPVFAGQATWTMAGCGLAMWGLWAAGAIYIRRNGDWLPLACLAVAVASLVPALPLFAQAKPYMAYLAAAAVAVTLSRFVPQSWLRGRFVPVILVIAAVAWGQGNMWLRLASTDPEGHSADPIVRAAALAREMAHTIQESPAAATIVVFQQPLRPEELARVHDHGSTSVKPTSRYTAIGGEVGLALALEHDDVRWLSSILQAPLNARIFADAGASLEDWGSCPEALVRAAVVDLYVGFHRQVYAELGRATEVGVDLRDLGFDPLPRGMQRAFLTGTQASRYRQWLLGQVTEGVISIAEYQTSRRRFDELMTSVEGRPVPSAG